MGMKITVVITSNSESLTGGLSHELKPVEYIYSIKREHDEPQFE
jgi:hypothetical protein